MIKEIPRIIPQEIEHAEALEKKEHEIILFNDDVNTFEHVIECLVRICSHSYIQAEQCAFIVHYSGKCCVKTGDLDDLVHQCNALLEEGLSAEVV